MDRKNLGGILAVLAVVIIAACSDEKLVRLSERTAALEKQLASMQADARTQKITLTKLSRALSKKKEATLDPAEKSFATVETDNGQFLVSVEDAKPYLDGQRLSLEIGNPYNMTYRGFKMKCLFGPRAPEPPKDDNATVDAWDAWSQAYATWKMSMKEKEIVFVEDLLPGKWTTVAVVLSPAKPEEVGYVSISITTNEVSLRR